MISRRNECPECGKKISDFTMDFEVGTLRCAHCQTDLRPDQILTNTTINFLATLIADEHRDAFLAKLGFEGQPVRRTPALALWFLIGLMPIGAFMGVLTQWERGTVSL